MKAAAKGIATGDTLTAAAGVLAAIGSVAVGTTSKPDPYGTAELLIDGQPVGGPQALKTVWNTYTPTWSSVSWVHVRLDHDVRLRVRLDDWDPVGGDDPIGIVEINSDDLVRAARLRKPLPVYVGDQGNQNQFVFVNVSVTIENVR